MSLLEVEGLRVRLPTTRGLVTVVDGVDYAVEHGEVFGVAGESGSGKTMSMLSLLGLLPDGAVVEGSVRFGEHDLLRMPRRRLREVAGRELAMVFQDPLTSLHPMLSIGRQLTEHVRLHLGLGRRDAERHALASLADVRIPDPASALRAFPHQFSGGMRQRIAIAIALACRPKLLIADEPTTALDVTVQAGILRLLDRLRRENDLSVVLITHDLGVMSAIADRVSIFYAGKVVEAGSREAVLQHAAPSVHPRAARCAAASGRGAGQAARRDRRRTAEPGRHSRRAAPSTPAAPTRRRAACAMCRRSSPPATACSPVPSTRWSMGQASKTVAGSNERRHMACTQLSCAYAQRRRVEGAPDGMAPGLGGAPATATSGLSCVFGMRQRIKQRGVYG